MQPVAVVAVVLVLVMVLLALLDLPLLLHVHGVHPLALSRAAQCEQHAVGSAGSSENTNVKIFVNQQA
jgi:Na+/H+-dicarboxylate symporter